MIKSWEDFHGINQDKFLKNLTEFLEDWIKFSEEEKNEYFERFLKEGEKKECKLTFLSRVLKYREETLLSTFYNSHDKRDQFQQKIKEIRELYFQINPRIQQNTELNKQRIEDLINEPPSYIISGIFLTDTLDLHYNTFRITDSFKEFNSQIQTREKNWKEDLKDDFLELLKQAPKEAFKSQEDLFYYLLLKDFYYFKSLHVCSIKDNFIKELENIYREKLSTIYKSKNFFSHSLFNSFKKKFKDFHDNNDYKSKLQILEEEKKKYLGCFDDKDHNEPLMNNKLNDSCADGVINSHDNSNNGNKRKLSEYSNEIEQNNCKKRSPEEYFNGPRNIQEKKSYTIFSIENILGIKETENQNHSKQYDQNLSNTEHSFSQSSISSQLLKLRESAVRYISEYDLEKTYEESQKSAFSIVSKRTFNQNPQVPYNLEYRNSNQENFNSNNLPTNQNFYNKLN